eukprot:gb/GEZN01009350.1/.p1 GENE.gb/GEZN01009350.1/~~gb/GEZN01009350.1/.p1  ORF type:complete len:315 (-),score=29.08 gb/GEZN01009350.1/:365-1309(-)
MVLAHVSAGLFTGSLHAITGPDHLAALLPQVMGRPFMSASMVGAYWGLGHGLGASGMGMLVFSLKGLIDVALFSDWAELFVGLTLVVIGTLGRREAVEWLKQLDKDKMDGPELVEQSSPSKQLQLETVARTDSWTESKTLVVIEASRSQEDSQMTAVNCEDKLDHRKICNPPLIGQRVRCRRSGRRSVGFGVICTGIIHGFSGSGHLLGVLPALTMPDWLSAMFYLLSFCVGTMLAMSVFTGVMGHLSLLSGKTFQRADLPPRLALAMSYVALALGCVWILKPFLFSLRQYIIQFASYAGLSRWYYQLISSQQP